METPDPVLVRKLHAMRAADRIFEWENARWRISRIVLRGDSTDAPNARWSVFGRRARA